MNPVEHDTKTAELMMERGKAESIAERMGNDRESESSYRRSLYNAEEHNAVMAQIAALDAELTVLDWAYTGWPRYWHVTNQNGHVHTSTSCSSCFPDTQFAWRTDLSGLTPQEVVDREAYNACTVCMPIAPVEQRAARERYNAEQREAKRAERQAKKDEKDAKARARAVKLVDKVEKAIEDMGGREVFTNDYSLYGHDGRMSVYDYTFNLPSTVGDILYEVKDRQDNGKSHRSMNAHVKAELVARGIM